VSVPPPAAVAAAGVSERLRADPGLALAVAALWLLLGLFVLYPLVMLLGRVFIDNGQFTLQGLAAVLTDRHQLQAFWNSLLLGGLVGLVGTVLGFAFAFTATRCNLPRWIVGLIDIAVLLPLVSPPFTTAIGYIFSFGPRGLITYGVLGIKGVTVYGMTSTLTAESLTYFPIAYLTLRPMLAAIDSNIEGMALSLGASRWRVFRTVTLPLLKPALANAFLLGFVESLADFGNPIVLAGNYEVLSTKIFFAVAGAQHDPGRAAALAMVLLALTLAAFWLQQRWLGRRSYVTVSGKGDGGIHANLPRPLWLGCFSFAALWIVFTLACYAIILTGGFVKDIGRGDLTPHLGHFASGFAVEWRDGAPAFVGSAWDSFFTTVEVAAVAAPLTAIVGLLSAYVITRHRFVGRRAFEFLTMVSFAIPGTVIGVSYIVAFNVAPLELTGGMAILVICFVFRNMPVGVRSGIAALAQIDRTLDEASSTLRASTVRTLSKVILPLLRPAIVATLVFSFTHAMTAVSAVIFLATAKYNLATVYIIGRVEAGEYPLAIAYSSVLIVFMLAVLLAVQKLVGESRLGRRAATELPTGL